MLPGYFMMFWNLYKSVGDEDYMVVILATYLFRRGSSPPISPGNSIVNYGCVGGLKRSLSSRILSSMTYASKDTFHKAHYHSSLGLGIIQITFILFFAFYGKLFTDGNV